VEGGQLHGHMFGIFERTLGVAHSMDHHALTDAEVRVLTRCCKPCLQAVDELSYLSDHCAEAGMEVRMAREQHLVDL
jgi:hypothetical protein